VCTRACTAGSECTDLGASATCDALPACPTTGTSCVRSAAKDAGPAECPSPAITPGTPCEPVDHPCWSTCSQGYREELTCTGGKWTPGHGLFPCADGGVGGTGSEGGASTADGGTYDDSCTTDGDCTDVDATCCGVCGSPSLSDKRALNQAGAANYHAFVCSGSDPCTRCVHDPDTIGAYCDTLSGRCKLSVLPWAACTTNTDCVLEARDCCGCNVSTSEDFIAVSNRASYMALNCGAAGNCRCGPTPDAGYVTFGLDARCDQGSCSAFFSGILGK
jgi:hypothetical protein